MKNELIFCDNVSSHYNDSSMKTKILLISMLTGLLGLLVCYLLSKIKRWLIYATQGTISSL